MSRTNPREGQRSFQLPEDFSARIAATLEGLGYKIDEPRRLAEVVLKLSDHYHAHPDSATPWHEPWAKAASIAYYFPLNFARNQAVALEARRLGFFAGIQHLIDFGSGTGSAMAAFIEAQPNSWTTQACDISRAALDLGRLLIGRSDYECLEHFSVQEAPKGFSKLAAKTLVMASYVFTELETLPSWWLEAEALAIIEPSTQDDGRRLMNARSELMKRGFSIWAPCTHQDDCPLLTKSARDWCHDRIHWQAPEWFTELEKHLPMKNRTITHSYLLARRTLPPPKSLEGLARLTGDMLIEKGKTRQSLCRGPEREFLAWFPQRFPKGIEPLSLERGRLVRFHGELELRSSELRLPLPDTIEEIGDDESL